MVIMLKRKEDIFGFKIKTKNRYLIGEVQDIYFDDVFWAVRYLVLNTNQTVKQKNALISPISIKSMDNGRLEATINLTWDQVDGGPKMDSHKPISREQEEKMAMHFNWPLYWPGTPARVPGVIETEPVELKPDESTHEVEDDCTDPKLRSANEVIGYHIEASDGMIGHLNDLIIDDQAWMIRYFVIDTRDWLHGKKVLVIPHWMDAFDWKNSTLRVGMTREKIKNSPEFDDSKSITREYEKKLYTHYGTPRYWK
jgi:hypothetical protein